MKRTARIAWSGLMGALSVACLLLTVFPFATYALPALASVFLMPVVIECGSRWATALYTAEALLALLLTPDIEAKLLFVAFFGYYPIIKSLAERTPIRSLEWVAKLLVFNGAVIVAYAVLFALGFSLDVFRIDGVTLPLWGFLLIFLLAGNVVFVLYDVALTRLLPLYFSRFQPLFRRLFR